MNPPDPDANINRSRILDCIAENPGLTVMALSARLRMNKGTIRYHLEVLVEQGKVLVRKISNRDVVFPSSWRYGSTDKGGLTRVQSRVLTVITDRNGLRKEELRKLLNTSKNELTAALSVLLRRNLVWKVKDGPNIIYLPFTRRMVLEHMMLDLVQMFLDRKIDQTSFMALKDQIEEEIEDL